MKIMIVGATSAIAHETAKCFAREGAEFFLVARNAEKMDDVCNDLKVRGAKRVETFLLDINDLERHEELVDAAVLALDGLDAVLISHGTLGDQQKRGCIAVVSSVAGDRGRKSNYVYGSAKAAVTAFLSGLRGRLASAGVTV